MTNQATTDDESPAQSPLPEHVLLGLRVGVATQHGCPEPLAPPAKPWTPRPARTTGDPA